MGKNYKEQAISYPNRGLWVFCFFFSNHLIVNIHEMLKRKKNQPYFFYSAKHKEKIVWEVKNKVDPTFLLI